MRSVRTHCRPATVTEIDAVPTSGSTVNIDLVLRVVPSRAVSVVHTMLLPRDEVKEIPSAMQIYKGEYKKKISTKEIVIPTLDDADCTEDDFDEDEEDDECVLEIREQMRCTGRYVPYSQNKEMMLLVVVRTNQSYVLTNITVLNVTSNSRAPRLLMLRSGPPPIPFVPTYEWQHVRTGQILPAGLEIRMSLSGQGRMARIGNPWKLQLWVDDPVNAFVRLDLDSRVSIKDLSHVLAEWCAQNMDENSVVTSSCEDIENESTLQMTMTIKSTSTPLNCNGTVKSTHLFQHYIDRDLSLMIGDVSSSDEEFAKVEEEKRVTKPHIDIRFTLDAPGILYVVALRMGSSLDYLVNSCFNREIPSYLQQTMWESRRNPAITEEGKNLTAFDRPRCVATPDALSVVRALEQNHSNVVASTQVLVEEALVPQTLILESDRIEYGDVYV